MTIPAARLIASERIESGPLHALASHALLSISDRLVGVDSLELPD